MKKDSNNSIDISINKVDMQSDKLHSSSSTLTKGLANKRITRNSHIKNSAMSLSTDSEDDEKLLKNYREVFQSISKEKHYSQKEKDLGGELDEEDGFEEERERTNTIVPDLEIAKTNRRFSKKEQYISKTEGTKKSPLDLEKILAMKKEIPYSLTVRPGFHYRGTLKHSKTLVYCIHHHRMVREFRFNGEIVLETDKNQNECPNFNPRKSPNRPNFSKRRDSKQSVSSSAHHKYYTPSTSSGHSRSLNSRSKEQYSDSDSSDEGLHPSDDDSDLEVNGKLNRNSSCFICYDRKNTIYFWDATKTPIPKPVTFNIRERLVEFCYISRYSIYAACAADEMILFYNRRFELLNSVHSPKSVIMIQYIPSINCLITGGTHHVTVWDLEIPDERVHIRINAVLKYHIDTGLPKDDWIKSIYLSEVTGTFYLVFKSQLLVYHLETGLEVEKLEHLSSRQITSVVFDDFLDYTITGFSDGTIKIWSINNTFIHEFSGHYKAIVGMSVYGKGSYLISGSLDRTVRLWNLKTFNESYRINLKEPPVQVQVMDHKHLFVQLRKNVIVWFMDDISKLYSSTNSSAFQLLSAASPHTPYRVLCLTEDGILRIFASSSRHIITSSIPFIDTEEVKYMTYSGLTNRAYLMMKSGEVWVLGTHLNPCVLMDIWKLSDAYKEDCNCILALDGKLQSSKETTNELFTLILGGSTNGQILVYGTNGIVQARYPIHAGPITCLASNFEATLLVTCGRDNSIRVCTVSPLDEEIIQVQISINITHIPSHMVIMEDQICCSSEDGSVNMYNFSIEKKVGGLIVRHSRDEDHTDTITVLTLVGSLKLFISASLDRSVRIWDTCNCLIREIQFDEPITSLCPCNEQGDLLVGLQNRVDIIKYYHYHSPAYIQIANTIPRISEIESPVPFDEDIDVLSHVKIEHRRNRVAFFRGSTASMFKCINHQACTTEVDSNIGLLEENKLEIKDDIELPDPRIQKMIQRRIQIVENAKAHLDKRKITGENENLFAKDFNRFLKYKVYDQKYRQKGLKKPKSGFPDSLDSLLTLPLLHDSRSLLNLRTIPKGDEILDEFRKHKPKEFLDEMFNSILDLNGNISVDHEVLHEKLQKYIRDKLMVAPDGVLPNSSLIHRTTDWLDEHHINLERLVIDLQGKNKTKVEVVIEDEDKKKRSEEYRAKLHSMLDTMKEQVRKPEEPEEPEVEEEPEEDLKINMHRYTTTYKGVSPPRNRFFLNSPDIIESFPIHIVKVMEKPWFSRIEDKVLETIARESDLVLVRKMKIPPTSDALIPILLEVFFDGSDSEKKEIFEYMRWLNDYMPIKDRETFYEPMNEFLVKDVASLSSTEQEIKADIVNGVIESFGSDNEDFLISLLQYLTLENLELQNIAVAGLQEMGFRKANSKVFIDKLQEINLRLTDICKENKKDINGKEELKNQRRGTIRNKQTKKTPKRDADITLEDAYEESELYRISTPERLGSSIPFKTTMKRWLRILLRKQLLITAARSNEASYKLKQYDIYGNSKETRKAAEAVNSTVHEKHHGDTVKNTSEVSHSKQKKDGAELEDLEGPVSNRKKLVATEIDKLTNKPNISEVLENELFNQCLNTLQQPIMIDFIHALSWYTRQLELKFEKEEAARLAAIQREEQKQQLLREAHERAIAEAEFRRKRKEIQEERALKIRQKVLNEEKKRQKKILIQKIPPLAKRYKGRIHRAKCHESRETIDFCFQLPPLESRGRYNSIATHLAQMNKSLPIEHVQPLPFGQQASTLRERIQLTKTGVLTYSKMETNLPPMPQSEQLTEELASQYNKPIAVETYITKRRYFLPDNSAIARVDSVHS